MKKRKIITGLVSVCMAAAMTLSLCACGQGGGEGETGGKITLKLWTPITGADLTEFHKMITRFNTSHENEIYVDHQSDVRDTHYNNLKTNIPNNGPDMAIIHSQLVKNYAENKYIVPIDDSFFTKETINPDDYQQNVMNTLKTDEGVLGFPLDMHPIVLFYNKNIVGDNALPTNFSELMALAKKLTNKDKGVWGLPISTMWPTEFTYTTALYQAGGEEIDTATSLPKFNTEAGAKAAENLRDMIYKYEVSPPNLQTDADLGLFTSGKAAFHIQGCWNLSSFMKTFGDKLGVMSLSGMLTDNTDAASKNVMARSHVFTVARSKRALSQRKKEAITTFIKWMGENSASWSLAGQIPAYNAARESDTFKNAPYVSQFGNPADFRTAASATYFESGYETVFQYVTKIMAGANTNIKEIMDQAEDEAKKAVNTEING